jgi:pimeloyl-ACP methyl ester carboxylesterase
MSWRAASRSVFLLLTLASCGSLSGAADRLTTRMGGGGEMTTIPVPDDYGEQEPLVARICRPSGDAPAPVAILAHGLPTAGEDRADMTPEACSDPSARWFRDHGYAVVMALRRGYGGSAGDWSENPGACASPDYARPGLQGAHDLQMILAYSLHQPWAKPDGAVIVGEDSGGWAVLAFASQPQTVAARLIDMGGVVGARSSGQLGHVCRPDLMIETAANFGATAKTPMLWIYGANDKIVPHDVVAALHNAFVRAGGQAELVQPEAFGPEGHDLLFADQGPQIWGPLLSFFLDAK